MRTSHFTGITVGLLAVACACGRAPAPQAVSTASLEAQNTWSAVELSQTGGLLGVDLDIQVTSGGQVVASNRRSGRTSSSRITEAQIAELGRLYAAAAPAQYVDRTSACADCYVYELTLTAGDESRTIRLDDASLAGTAAEPLIAYLTRLRDEELAAP